MIFILLTFLAAFSIEALGTITSIIGLTSLFGMNYIIISLAVALDLGKIVVVTLLYTHMKTLGAIMRTYAIMAAIITMVITSAGAGAYLTAEFQKAIIGTQEGSLKVQVLKDQQTKYEERKKQIDLQIANLPEKTTVNQRLRLMNGFKAEQQELQNKIAEIDKQLPALQINQIGVESKVGPILYIAKAFNIPVEEAVKWVILMIIVVFDPLAVFLIVAGNFLIRQRKLEAEAKPKEAVALPKFPGPQEYIMQDDSISTSSHFLPEPQVTPPMPPVKPPRVEVPEIQPIQVPATSQTTWVTTTTKEIPKEECIINDTLKPQSIVYDTEIKEPIPERKPDILNNSTFFSVEDEEDPYEAIPEPKEPEELVYIEPSEVEAKPEIIEEEPELVVDKDETIPETIPETISDSIPENVSIQENEKSVIEQQVIGEPSIQESIHDAISETIPETIVEVKPEEAKQEPERDTITLSSLGYVKLDDRSEPAAEEIGYKTGVFKSGSKTH